MLCSGVYVFFLVPETKAVPLEKMDRLFSSGLPARKAHAVVLAELRVEDQEFRRDSIQGMQGKADESGYIVDEKRVESV